MLYSILYILIKDDWKAVMEYFDIKAYLAKLAKNWLIIVLCGIIGLSGAFVYSEFVATPVYESKAKVSYYDSVAGSLSVSTLQTAYEMIENSLVVLNDNVTYKKVAEIVNEELGTDYSPKELGKYISYAREGDTFFLKIIVRTPDPELSAIICNAVLAIAPEIIIEYVANIPVVPLDNASVNYTPVSPNTMKNMVLGLMLALILVCGAIFLFVFFDNTVSDVERLKEKYDLSVLGTIPNISTYAKKHT